MTRMRIALVFCLGWMLIGCREQASDAPTKLATADGAPSPIAAKQNAQPAKPRFIKQIDWAGRGQWLKADLHVHTKFSDGSHSIAEVVDRAAANGCTVLAITDHADRNLTAASRPYSEQIDEARRTHPDMVIVAGLEWNVPPHGGDEHAKVLVPHSPNEGQLLAEFKSAFDDLGLDEHKSELAEQGLRWLAENATSDGVSAVVMYNHPNRKRDESGAFIAEFSHLRGISDLLVGFEGAPGHQRAKRLGSYKKKQELVDRWDPAAANLGDAWDQLLAKGIDVWAAEASSDFHNADPNDLHDFWPGEFSETWLYVPEKSVAGVLRALKAGAFFGVHGHIAREAQILVNCEGLPRPAQAGETIAVPAGSDLEVQVECQAAEIDWQGKPSRVDAMELIAIDQDGSQLVSTHEVTADAAALNATLAPTGKFVVLRARGRRSVADGPDLLFYTNPVRVLIE